jgi:adhesin/invasin
VGLAIDSAGNLYVADANNHRIREITADGYIFTIAGNGTIGYSGDGGSGSAAALNFPRGVAIGPDGRVYIADTGNSVIRVLTAAAGGGVTNAGSFASKVSPGALASIFGAGFGSLTQQGNLGLVTNALPTVLGGISVTVNGTAAPLLFISPGQINFQIPWKTTANSSGNAVVAVLVNGGSVTAAQVPLQSAAPGLFTNGAAAIVQNQDFNVNDSDHPAPAGSTITAYLTGSGPVSPAMVDGTPTPNAPLTNITSSKSAKIGNSDAVVSFAGLTPGFIGLVQFNIVVPAGLAPGTYPLTVTIDGQTSNTGNIVVK